MRWRYLAHMTQEAHRVVLIRRCLPSCLAVFAKCPNCRTLILENSVNRTLQKINFPPTGVETTKYGEIIDQLGKCGSPKNTHCRQIKLNLCFVSSFRVGVFGETTTHRKPLLHTTPSLPKIQRSAGTPTVTEKCFWIRHLDVAGQSKTNSDSLGEQCR